MPTRPPNPALRPFIDSLWVSDHSLATPIVPYREHAAPSGGMSLVIRLSNDPIRIADNIHPQGHNFGHGVIGGARSSFYVRELSAPARSIGASLLPGAAQALFGVSALELAGRHTSLDDVWGAHANTLRERLVQLSQPHRQLDLFEMYLLTRVPQVKGIHPAIAQALADIHVVDDVRSLVARSGFSHRRFIELFGSTVGLTPKRYGRVLRFQRMLKQFARRPVTWTELALDAGYSDQAHFNREFREFIGVTPEEYRRAAPRSPAHVLAPEIARPQGWRR